MKKHVYTICVIAAALFMALMSFLDPLYSVDTYITDHVYSRLNGTDPRIVIVGIDEETLLKFPGGKKLCNIAYRLHLLR